MSRTREQQEAVDRIISDIDAEMRLFDTQLKFFQSDAVKTISVENMEVRYERMKLIASELDKLQRKYYAQLQANEDDEICDRIKRFDGKYCEIAGQIMKHIRKNTPSTSSQQTETNQVKSSLAKTQRIPLPEFDGTPNNWIKYRDMFRSLIHDSNAYSDIEKFHYLQMSMKIPLTESNVLTIFPHTAENYQKAWKAVCERYDDKRKLLNHHLTSLFDIKKMTNSSASELRRIVDSFESHIASLGQLGYKFSEEDQYPNLIFVFMVTQCLDEETLREWRKDTPCDTPTYKELHSFMIARWRSLDDIQLTKKVPIKQPDPKSVRVGKVHVSNKPKTSSDISCPLCSESHVIRACEKFKSRSVDDRHKIVKEKHLCWNCLSSSHVSKECKSKFKCHTCDKPHHTLLHFDKSIAQHVERERQPQAASAPVGLSPDVAPFQPYKMSKQSHFCDTEASGSTAHSTHSVSAKRHTLLSTVVVFAVDRAGESHLCRALLDSGSDTNFMTTQFARKLKLKLRDSCFSITGVDEKTSIVRHRATATIKSRFGPFDKQLDFALLNTITGKLPNRTILQAKYSIPDGYFLADPKFYETDTVDLLISADVFYESLLSGKLHLSTGLMMIETKFGWIMGGSFESNVNRHSSFLSCFQYTESAHDDDLAAKLDKFLAADDCDFTQPSLTAEEKFCEELFSRTTTRDDHGRFVVQMPIKAHAHPLGNNLMHAKQALSWQEKRRQKDNVYNNLYVEYMNDYIDTRNMQEVDSEDKDGSYYLPHHGVVKMSSTTTKVRPVFNASSKSETGISLNDILCVGPTVQPESFDILLRFRERKFVITGDITKMYRQIMIHPSQRNMLRILWREDINSPVKHFQLNTVTFGTASAPFLATRVIKQLAIDNRELFPQASAIIESSFYVDDLLFGIDSVDDGIAILNHIRYILIKAGMSLCKISSNNSEITASLEANLISSQHEDSTQVTKTLGIGYTASTDQFSYQLKLRTDGASTKAEVLSEIASIYDPIGWIGPVVLKAKLFLKSIWIRKLQWKDKLPDDLIQEWNAFREKLHFANNVRINRHCVIVNHVTVELHGFCDASNEAYGAVIYAHSYDNVGHAQTSIICAKSRVAPKSQKTLARLELCGATLLAKLIARTKSIFSIPVNDVTLWSDSTIVLNWIIMSPSRLTTFVGNRTAVIQELTHNHTWKHIRGSDNPADVISRGLFPDEIEMCDIWWTGPSFFKLPRAHWPDSLLVINENDPEVIHEMKKTLTSSSLNDMFQYIETRFSSARTLRRVVSFVKRFANNAKPSSTKLTGPLSIEEIESAEVCIIKILHKTFFPQELKTLEQNRDFAQHNSGSIPSRQISSKSPLISIAPFLGEDGLIRVGGRIRASPELTTHQKHPIVLPNCHFTKILIREMHVKFAHPGPLLLRSIVRENYYPLKAKDIIRKVIHECFTCFRFKPTTTNQFMSDLPSSRVTMTPPFTNTAVDYTGFYNIRASMTKRSTAVKAYIALFKCMCTGAIHLELVTELTTQAFIAALDRFISRRGLSITLFTDNATYFEGADNELKRIVQHNQRDVQQHCIEQAIEWKFTTPRAPHAGGIYESGIKSMKHHLKRVIGEKLYTFEQFTTILCKIEAIVNSRPLTPMSEDPNDLQVLTPGHFLTGRSLLAKPERDFIVTPRTHLDRWENLQKVQQQFWYLWYHDYLNTLQTRPINFREKFHFNVGDMVLVKDSNLPPLKWLTGRVVKVFPGKDHLIRNVRIITKLGEKDRHVKYLCFLPMEHNSHSNARESVANATSAVL